MICNTGSEENNRWKRELIGRKRQLHNNVELRNKEKKMVKTISAQTDKYR